MVCLSSRREYTALDDLIDGRGDKTWPGIVLAQVLLGDPVHVITRLDDKARAIGYVALTAGAEKTHQLSIAVVSCSRVVLK